MKKIKVTLHKDGTQKIEVLGAKGDECLEFTRPLEERLGISVGDRVLKEEFYASDQEVEKDREVVR
jgi:hypothetical protein